MNIQQAKEEIARTYRAYLKKNEDGSCRIAPEKQRPVLLIGPPGIGKTAIMKQIADETGCGLVAYSMTHHTRQSAIGLPYISQKEYGGIKRPVTEYTMSEIVASVYEYMEKSGKKSGILFLDEINCVSETLEPVILQLLQNKTFGNVSLPEDWIIVTAGNPPEYNKSVREFDMVTLDRVKRIDVEADLDVWKTYAEGHGIHPAIMAYFSVYPDHFYNITDTNRGQFFVTARGWEDLSLMLTSYEEDGIKVDADWFLQYLQHEEIARSFAFFYSLFDNFKAKSCLESSDAADMLLKEPERTENLSSTECLSLASMLYHPVEIAAKKLSEERKRIVMEEEFISHMPSDDAFADDESV
ncbi:MAG: AAA family ATPase, partial [Firmicutes bacterium]|nr:AAA family ATPase [Bacillota bacterium]